MEDKGVSMEDVNTVQEMKDLNDQYSDVKDQADAIKTAIATKNYDIPEPAAENPFYVTFLDNMGIPASDFLSVKEKLDNMGLKYVGDIFKMANNLKNTLTGTPALKKQSAVAGVKGAFEFANNFDPTGICGVISAFINDSCYSEADIPDPFNPTPPGPPVTAGDKEYYLETTVTKTGGSNIGSPIDVRY